MCLVLVHFLVDEARPETACSTGVKYVALVVSVHVFPWFYIERLVRRGDGGFDFLFLAVFWVNSLTRDE